MAAADAVGPGYAAPRSGSSESFDLIGHALIADLLPPLRGPHVASALIASWLVAWVVASIRYQR